ncbi:putative glycerol kinase 5 [Anneissia japonica]|uniref:putative glycerol kinase 5 n=1 Tax=Anneissia japonica TaxID=1529436 RepID=UPI0014256135|nr:putative glycerol kinase 5 [Anneissia japonica]
MNSNGYVNDNGIIGTIKLLHEEEERTNTGDVYVLGVDFGTTTVRCQVFDRHSNIVGSARQKVQLHCPQDHTIELIPDTVWAQFTTVVKQAISDANISVKNVACMGISVQRATITLWDRHTGTHYCNFISWNDTRAEPYANVINQSLSFKGLGTGAKLLHILTRQKRWEAASAFHFQSQHAILRLAWLLNNNQEMKSEAKAGNVLFGTLETWLVWKLTGGKVHATEPSNICATVLYDVFKRDWNNIHINYFGIPHSILPELKDTSDDFGVCEEEIFGGPIPIHACVGDQQAAMFGQCCFDEGDIKVTMGTGTFINLTTGAYPCVPTLGTYPMVGWKIGSEVSYTMEAMDSDSGTVLTWLESAGFISKPEDSQAAATRVKSSNGLCFIPAFSGLQSGINDNTACCCLINITPAIKQEHIVRAALESLAFRVVQIFNTLENKTNIKISDTVKFDGGVSNSDFVLQLVSSLLNKKVDRPDNLDMSCLGAAFLAGLKAGVWKSKEELKAVRKTKNVFKPKADVQNDYKPTFKQWAKAARRSMNWNI